MLEMDSNYKVAAPDDQIVLVLSMFWLPIGITTAKEGMRKLISGGRKDLGQNARVYALSRDANQLHWEDWVASREHHFDKQPVFRAGSAIYPVPTILLTTSSSYYKGRVAKPKLHNLYSYFKGVCQLCGERKPIKAMSIEHILPKSKGGDNTPTNLSMTCRDCNSRRGNLYPVAAHDGNDLKPYTPPMQHKFPLNRPEWLAHLPCHEQNEQQN